MARTVVAAVRGAEQNLITHAATVFAGALVTYGSANKTAYCVAGSSTDGFRQVIESERKGLEDAYESGSKVPVDVAHAGCRRNARVGNSQTVTLGALLKHNGSGDLAVTTTASEAVAVALEAATTGAAEKAFVLVEVL